MMMSKRMSAVLLSLACSGALVHAHDIAVFPEAGPDGVRLRVRYGHPGDYQDTVAGKLITLDAISPSGETRSYAGRLRDDAITLVTSPITDLTAPGTWLFSTTYDNGFFLRTEDGRSVNTTRAEYPAAKTATHNIKLGKALFAVGTAGAGFDRVLGHRLELVPRQNPFAASRTVDVAVLFDGKPLAAAEVYVYPERESEKEVTLTTDAAGVVKVPIERSGRFLLGTEHGVASRHPELATRDVYAASLVFVRP